MTNGSQWFPAVPGNRLTERFPVPPLRGTGNRNRSRELFVGTRTGLRSDGNRKGTEFGDRMATNGKGVS